MHPIVEIKLSVIVSLLVQCILLLRSCSLLLFISGLMHYIVEIMPSISVSLLA